ncbi:MAG: ribonuclease Z [Thermoproteales archaeon]|nr:ribonuclease Z [Thermoproteales archaeon]
MIELSFLGTGGTYPRRGRNTVCIVAKIRDLIIMLDCGEGCQKRFIPKFGANSRMIILLSHLHGDHVLGLPGLIFSFNLLERTKPITIVGPLGIQRFITGFLKALNVKLKYPLELLEIGTFEGLLKIYGDKSVRIYSWHSRHTSPTLGFLIYENKPRGRFNVEKAKKLGIPRGRLWKRLQNGLIVGYRNKLYYPEDVLDEIREGIKVAYSGDSLPSLDLINLVGRVDVLIHEASFTLDNYIKARESGHATVFQVAELAENMKVETLVLCHITPRYDGRIDDLYNEARQIFGGKIIVPKDGDEIRIK